MKPRKKKIKRKMPWKQMLMYSIIKAMTTKSKRRP